MQQKKYYSNSSFFLALLFIFISIFFYFLWKNTNPYTFKHEPVDVVGFDSNDIEGYPERIVIDSLGINLEVGASEIIDGYWRVYDDKAGWGIGSGLPGKPGNQVIFAHAKEGLFAPLEKIKLGDVVKVKSKGGWYEYSVKEIQETYPNNIALIQPTEDETLTLYTCAGFKDQKRLVVVGKRLYLD